MNAFIISRILIVLTVLTFLGLIVPDFMDVTYVFTLIVSRLLIVLAIMTLKCQDIPRLIDGTYWTTGVVNDHLGFITVLTFQLFCVPSLVKFFGVFSAPMQALIFFDFLMYLTFHFSSLAYSV